MDKKMLADWLRDIARHIEDDSPLIKDIGVDNAISEEGMAKKIITITFNMPGRSSTPDVESSGIHRH